MIQEFWDRWPALLALDAIAKRLRGDRTGPDREFSRRAPWGGPVATVDVDVDVYLAMGSQEGLQGGAFTNLQIEGTPSFRQ